MKQVISIKMGTAMFRFAILALVLTGCVSVSVAEESKVNKKVLIYTKNGEGYVHKCIPASVVSLKSICEKNGWAFEATDDPSVFTTEKIAGFDVLVFSNTNNKTFATDAQKKVFQEYIRGGGGFVAIHSACASEREWPWYWSNVGCKFVTHPRFQKFDVKVLDKKHPSTEFLPDIWKWEDECYIFDHLSLTTKVLLAADLRTVEFKEERAYPGKTFGDYTPLCWYQEFEGGRQWYTALGHAPEHYEDPTFKKHLEGGIRWAMGIE